MRNLMKRDKCIYCVDYVNHTDAWEDAHGVLHHDIHIACGIQAMHIIQRVINDSHHRRALRGYDRTTT
jgi:hypothetical protein